MDQSVHLTENIKTLLDQVLQLKGRGASMSRESGLLGVMPEFDSMAVVSVITAIEQRFGIEVVDDEIDAGTFASVGDLVDYVEAKLAQEG